jgi:hypothetical protein
MTRLASALRPTRSTSPDVDDWIAFRSAAKLGSAGRHRRRSTIAAAASGFRVTRWSSTFVTSAAGSSAITRARRVPMSIPMSAALSRSLASKR